MSNLGMFGPGPNPTPTTEVPEFQEDGGAGGKKHIVKEEFADKESAKRLEFKNLDRDDEEIAALLAMWYYNIN